MAVRQKQQTLEDEVEKMASLPFVDVLYIRCDWRNVQKQAGKLDLDPVWDLTMAAARRTGYALLFAFSPQTLRFNLVNLHSPSSCATESPW